MKGLCISKVPGFQFLNDNAGDCPEVVRIFSFTDESSIVDYFFQLSFQINTVSCIPVDKDDYFVCVERVVVVCTKTIREFF